MNLNKQWKKLTKIPYLSDYFVIIFFPVVVAWHFHGGDAVRLLVISVLASLGFELLFHGLIYRQVFKRNRRCDFPLAAYMGLCTAMALPASAPLWFPILGLTFAYLLISLLVPFLAKNNIMFSRLQIIPAGAAVAFLSLFPKILFTYTPILAQDTDEALEGIQALPSLANMLGQGAFPEQGMYAAGDILTGAVTGPLGTGCIVVILAAFVFLLLRRPVFALAPSSFILTVLLWAFLFPRQGLGRFASMGYELSAGMLLFAVVFLFSIPKYLPRNNLHKLIYGAACALLTMLLRRILPIEETVFIAMFMMSFTLIFFNKNVCNTAHARRVPREKAQGMLGNTEPEEG